MKKIKKNMLCTFILVFMLIPQLYAETITIVPAGQPGGNQFTRANLYKDVLTKMGHSVVFENIPNTLEGSKYLENNVGKDKTVIMMYTGNAPSQIGYNITDKNFVLTELEEPQYWCQSNVSKDKQKLNVGLVKNMNSEFSDELFKKLGKETVYLRYKNSGDLYNAITSGDIDVMFTNQSQSLKLIENNQGICIANTSIDDHIGIPSIYKVIDTKKVFPGNVLIVISNNPSSKLRNLLIEANKDPLFTEWRTKRKYSEISNRSRKKELSFALKTQELWK